MSAVQFQQTVAAEREWLEEIEARRVEDANEILAEMQASRADVEFIERMATLYPQLKATWPGRTK